MKTIAFIFTFIKAETEVAVLIPHHVSELEQVRAGGFLLLLGKIKTFQ